MILCVMNKTRTQSKPEKRIKEDSEIQPGKENLSFSDKKDKQLINLPVKIFLTGFMGSGKSYWGHIWAKKSGLTFYDLDSKIEKAFRMSLTDIFEKKSEEKFRELERYH